MKLTVNSSFFEVWKITHTEKQSDNTAAPRKAEIVEEVSRHELYLQDNNPKHINNVLEPTNMINDPIALGETL